MSTERLKLVDSASIYIRYSRLVWRLTGLLHSQTRKLMFISCIIKYTNEDRGWETSILEQLWRSDECLEQHRNYPKHINVEPREQLQCYHRIAAQCYFLDPETGLQALRTLFFPFFLLLVLRLFHFTTDRRQTSHTHWWQHYPQSHRVLIS